MFGDSDLSVFFDPGTFGVPVVFGGSTAYGILDQAQVIHLADAGFGGFNTLVPTLQLPYNAFNPMPNTRDLLTVNEQNYTVTERTSASDGAILTYSLKITS